jgi:hypothetical protein
MEKERYMLIHMERDVFRFDTLRKAQLYALRHCRNSYQFYIIVDTKIDEVVYKWSY